MPSTKNAAASSVWNACRMDRSPVPRIDLLRAVVDRCPRHRVWQYRGIEMPKNQKPQLLKSGATTGAIAEAQVKRLKFIISLVSGW
jgi:hypothetical protein